MERLKKFADWANRFGRANLARECGVTWSAVYCWTIGTTKPKPDNANKIVELSAGELSLSDIYPTEVPNG